MMEWVERQTEGNPWAASSTPLPPSHCLTGARSVLPSPSDVCVCVVQPDIYL